MAIIYKINFSYEIAPKYRAVLSAEVKLHDFQSYYIVRNISNSCNADHIPILPDMSIKAVRNKDGDINWVHTDSEQESILSKVIGDAIAKTHSVEISNLQVINE